MPLLFPACAVPCLADVSLLRLRLNGAWFGLLVDGALPQLSVGLPLAAFPVDGALPQLAVVPPPQPSFDLLPRLPAVCFRLPVGGVHPRLADAPQLQPSFDVLPRLHAV